MSLDYPFYEELCRLRHRAAWWWMIGDRLYYLGLLCSVLGISCATLGLGSVLLGFGWRWLIVGSIAFPAGALVFVVGGLLKGHAYTLAERDGISSAEVYQRGANHQQPDAEPGAAADRGNDVGLPGR